MFNILCMLHYLIHISFGRSGAVCCKKYKMMDTLVFLVVFICMTVCVLGHSHLSTKQFPTCGYEACPKLDENAFNVHLIPHSHDDVGWLKNVDQYYFQDVEHILSSAVTALNQNPERRFIQVETAYLKKWWTKQSNSTKEQLRDLINSGRLEIVNGAWSMNDEAAVNYQSTIDQFTLGLRFLEDNIGICARPRIGWQIDPFGHSKEHAFLLTQLGFDALFFARLDYRDKDKRVQNKTMELLWQASQNVDDSEIFTSVLFNHYSAPYGFCHDITCYDDPIIDDTESFEYNLESKVKSFTEFIKKQAASYATNNILITMGDDFKYKAALINFLNMDKLINGFKMHPQYYKHRRINVMYSTPSCYVKAVNDFVLTNKINLPLKTDDFFPYADDTHKYWTGYFTSRPTSKRFERQGNNLLQVVKQLAVAAKFSHSDENIQSLKEAMGIMQHHDAITGTEQTHVMRAYHRTLSSAFAKATNASNRAISGLISSANVSLELESCILSNVSVCHGTSGAHFFAVVYNPLSQNVTHYVQLPVSPGKYIVKDPKGEIVNNEITDEIEDFGTRQNKALTFKTLLPPMSLSIYEIKKQDYLPQDLAKSTGILNGNLIGYKNINIQIDNKTGLLSSITMHNITMNVTQEFMYYLSVQNENGTSGAYLFRPNGTAQKLANKPIKYKVRQGEVLTEVRQYINDWVTQIIRIYKEERDFIEFDWIVGPVDVRDGIGKEVISRFKTDLNSAGIFYTDSNGRQHMQRRRDFRHDYTYTNEENITANYYPVTSRIVVKDENIGREFAVLTDRSEGGSSLKDGEVELMLHRRCLYDDGKGVGEALNEVTESRYGIQVRGQHYVILGDNAENKELTLAAIQRRIALKKLLSPWTFVTKKDISKLITKRQISLLTQSLPDNVHILTLEPFNNTNENSYQILIRLEHIMEKNEGALSENVSIDLKKLFKDSTISKVREVIISANMNREDRQRLRWSVSHTEGDNHFNGSVITLKPMEIRTFVADFH